MTSSFRPATNEEILAKYEGKTQTFEPMPATPPRRKNQGPQQGPQDWDTGVPTSHPARAAGDASRPDDDHQRRRNERLWGAAVVLTDAANLFEANRRIMNTTGAATGSGPARTKTVPPL